ncbi:MAG: diguanylate cyclase [Spirochaetales bacterium]
MPEQTSTEDLIRLSFFTDMAHDIASADTLRSTLDRVMAHIGRIFAPRTWSLMLHDPEQQELEFALVTGGAEAEILRGHRIPDDTGIAGWILKNREPVIVTNVASDSRFDPSVDELSGFTTENIIGVPLLSQSSAFGVIELVNKLNGETFTALDLKILATIADFAGVAIEKAYYLKALDRIASIDHVTGLYNRRSLSRTLDRELARCKRTGRELSVLMIDINDFKKLNDSHGHVVGDRVLHHLAQLLEENMREVDVLARYGGDEFFVIMPDIDLAGAQKAAVRISDLLSAEDPTRPVPYSVSIGTFSGCPDSSDQLFQGADFDLYSQKDRFDDATIANLDDHIRRFLDEEERDKG